jgi:hypothetical protein
MEKIIKRHSITIQKNTTTPNPRTACFISKAGSAIKKLLQNKIKKIWFSAYLLRKK